MTTPSSMPFSVAVENIKCGGCASTIVTKLSALPGVSQVAVDVATGQVAMTLAVEAVEEQLSEGVALEAFESLRQAVQAQLSAMGYPPVGSLEGLSAVGAKAKSFVSCAIGKMRQGDESK